MTNNHNYEERQISNTQSNGSKKPAPATESVSNTTSNDTKKPKKK